ncbi:MAG: methionine synthase [Clostridiales bacterium]|jgi:5-methyltetrahydrofolate--homocysteine methyltransferase|nr:methionine synthase [Clostridiales bacterium]
MIIDKSEVMRYAGIRGKLDDETLSANIDRLIEKTYKLFSGKSGYKIFVTENAEGGILLAGADILLTGDAIKRHLKSCGRAALMYATAGYGIDREILRLQQTALGDALIIDACAVSGLESLCDTVTEEIGQKAGCGITMRFSPGYGDLPITLNRDIITALDAGRRGGVVLNSGGMMSPSKTVTAIVGIKEER